MREFVSVFAVVFIAGLVPAASAAPDGGRSAAVAAPLSLAQATSEDGAAMPPPAPGQRRQWRRHHFAGAVPEQGEMPPARGQPPGFPPAGPGMDGPRAFQGRGAGGQGRFPARMGGRQFFGGPLDLTVLGLSDEQKQKIMEMRSQSAGRAREVRRTLQARRAELKQLMFDPAASDAQIRAKRRELRETQDQLEDIVLGDFLGMRSVLTAEQRQRLPEIRPRPGGRSPGMAGRVRPRPGGPGVPDGPGGGGRMPPPQPEPPLD